jgi:hypothetical protein
MGGLTFQASLLAFCSVSVLLQAGTLFVTTSRLLRKIEVLDGSAPQQDGLHQLAIRVRMLEAAAISDNQERAATKARIEEWASTPTAMGPYVCVPIPDDQTLG